MKHIVEMLKDISQGHNIAVGLKEDGTANYIKCGEYVEYILSDVTLDELQLAVDKLLKKVVLDT